MIAGYMNDGDLFHLAPSVCLKFPVMDYVAAHERALAALILRRVE